MGIGRPHREWCSVIRRTRDIAQEHSVTQIRIECKRFSHAIDNEFAEGSPWLRTNPALYRDLVGLIERQCMKTAFPRRETAVRRNKRIDLHLVRYMANKPQTNASETMTDTFITP